MFPVVFFFFNDTATTEIYTLSLHDALPISRATRGRRCCCSTRSTTSTPPPSAPTARRSEEHTSELQSRLHLVCRLLLEKKKKNRDKSDVESKKNEPQPASQVAQKCRVRK